MSADRDELEADTGLEARYHVTKINDPAGKHADCRYFVLDPKHDPLARSAMISYAMAARDEGMEALADDLLALVGECEAADRAAELSAQLHQMQVEQDYGTHGTGAGEAAKW